MAQAVEKQIEERITVKVDAPPPPQTSVAENVMPANHVWVQFRKWTAHGLTAYQKGQYAGFPIPIALNLEAAGVAVIDPAFRRDAVTRDMVRK